MTKSKRDDLSRIAQRLHDHHSHAHRGGYVETSGDVLIFGNDGYKNSQKARGEVAALRAWAGRTGLAVAGFATDPSEHTWVLRLRPGGLAAEAGLAGWLLGQALDVLWSAWHGGAAGAEAAAFESLQRNIASSSVAALGAGGAA